MSQIYCYYRLQVLGTGSITPITHSTIALNALKSVMDVLMETQVWSLYKESIRGGFTISTVFYFN